MVATNLFDTATSGIFNSQANLRVISDNIANANTAGFSKKYLTSTPTTDGLMVGVDIGNVSRLANSNLYTDYINKSSDQAYSDTRVDYMDQVAAALGSSKDDDGSVQKAFNDFYTSLQEFSSNPTYANVGANSVPYLNTYKSLITKVQDFNAYLNDTTTQANQDLADNIQQVNKLLDNIKIANDQIGHSNSTTDITSLQDKRDTMIQQLSTYLDVKVIKKDNNMVELTTKSGVVLLDYDARPFSMDTTLNPTTGVNVTRIYSASSPVAPINTSLQSGALKSILNVVNTDIPNLKVNLYNTVNQLVTDTNTLGWNSTTVAPASFFKLASPASTNIDANIGAFSLNTSLMNPNASGITAALNNMNPSSATSSLGQLNSMVTNFSINVADARTDQDVNKQDFESSQQAIQDFTGVNIDEEMVNLQQYQKSYAASAKMLDIANQLIQQLMSIGT